MGTDHHLILGTLTDILTGRERTDTHDERYRQALARLLLEKGHDRQSIAADVQIPLDIDGRKATSMVDLAVAAAGRTAMIVRYGPGSIVTRHKPSVAASRVVEPYQVPVVVVTNGREAEILDGATGKVTASGLDAVPTADELEQTARKAPFSPIDDQTADKARRILMAFDVIGACNCDDDTCT